MNTPSEPLNHFSDCHAGILQHLQTLDELHDLLAPAARARNIALDALAFFREAIFGHHADEERELFPAVLASARAGQEHDQVLAMVMRLVAQHRELEALWKQLERGLKQVVAGQPAELKPSLVRQLVSAYSAHAADEEQHFLPLSETILGRNDHHMAALGLSLHMRHMKSPVASYI